MKKKVEKVEKDYYEPYSTRHPGVFMNVALSDVGLPSFSSARPACSLEKPNENLHNPKQNSNAFVCLNTLS